MKKTMRYFKFTYLENGRQREKYFMLEEEPELGRTHHSMLAAEMVHPDVGYGGVYGGEIPYSFFIPKDSQIEEISPETFMNVLIESLRRNYVSKREIRDLLGI